MSCFLAKGQGFDYTRSASTLLFGSPAGALHHIVQKPFLRRYSGIEASTSDPIAATLRMLVFLPGLDGQVMTAPAGAIEVVYVCRSTCQRGPGSVWCRRRRRSSAAPKTEAHPVAVSADD